jgi:inner membrane protein
MATSIGHALTGLALARAGRRPAGRADWRWYLFAAFAANAPDLDFLPGLLVGDANRYHQLGSHSLGAVAVFGLLASLCARWLPGWPAGPGSWGALLYASHLLVDSLTLDTRAPFGIPLLWPFSQKHFHAPFSLFLDVHHGAAGEGLGAFVSGLPSLHNLQAVAIELLVLGPLLPLAGWLARRRAGAATRPDRRPGAWNG